MATLSDGKIAFFFGAGAEYGMGFPTGSEYTERTMLHKNMELYDALEKFYKARTTEELAENIKSNSCSRRTVILFMRS